MTTKTKPDIKWTGKSGTKYGYWIYKLPPNFVRKPGNYIFAKQNAAGNWIAIYIGETKELDERFDNHHKMLCIKKHGATHILAHVNTSGKDARLAEEADLVSQYNPPCNG